MISDDIIKAMIGKRFLTITEAAAVLRVSRLTLYRYINAGLLTAYKFGRDYRIEEKEFERFVGSKRVPKGGKK